MKKPVLNLADAQVHSGSSGANFEYSMAEVAEGLGARSIGANVTRVPPGKAAFPLHHHRANEEHFFILSGTGVLRVGAEHGHPPGVTVPVPLEDLDGGRLACPVGAEHRDDLPGVDV